MQQVKILDDAVGVANDCALPGGGLKENAIWIENPSVTVARLKHGTASGASAVLLRFDFVNDAGQPCTVMAQMTMANFLNAAACQKAFEERDAALQAALRMPPAGKVQ